MAQETKYELAKRMREKRTIRNGLFLFAVLLLMSFGWALFRWAWIHWDLFLTVDNDLPKIYIPLALSGIYFWILFHSFRHFDTITENKYIALIKNEYIALFAWVLLFYCPVFAIFLASGEYAEKISMTYRHFPSIASASLEDLKQTDLIRFDSISNSDIDIFSYGFLEDKIKEGGIRSGRSNTYRIFKVYPLLANRDIFIAYLKRHSTFYFESKEEWQAWQNERVLEFQSITPTMNFSGKLLKRVRRGDDNYLGFQRTIGKHSINYR